MTYKAEGKSELSVRSDLLVVLVSSSQLRSKKRDANTTLKDLDREFGKTILQRLGEEGFKGKSGESSLVTLPGSKRLKALLVVGWDEKESEEVQYRKLARKISATARSRKYRRVAVSMEHLSTDSVILEAFAEEVEMSKYSFTKYKTSSKSTATYPRDITFLTRKKIAPKTFSRARALSEGAGLAKDLLLMPANDCNPRFLVSKCRQMAKKAGLRIQVYDRARLSKLGAGALISVAEGSKHPPYLIKMTYRPRTKAKKVISLVGKGVTFDTGGYSIKSGGGMMEMKGDMGGAAAVIGAMQAIAALKPKVEVRAYIPAVENMVNEKATRPGDIVTSACGKTVEILNTDAEGRLILADSLTIAENEKCNVIIDFATLTGASIAALGMDYAAVFSDDEELVEQLRESGSASNENLWRMPLAPEYEHELKSSVADLKNIGSSRWGGAITAALFLKNFVRKTTWAHVDLAGPSLKGISKAKVSGFGARTIARYVDSF